MDIAIFDSKQDLGRAAADRAAAAIGEAIARGGEARVIAATGASQFEFLDALTARKDVDWPRVEMFHLDEYVGVSDTHPASFRRYLRERIVERVHPRAFHFLAGDAPDPATECRRVGAIVARAPVDVAFVGIGENGHLAFNDPPADFETEEPYLVVALDDACRRQQLGEGWFATIDDVPRRAISMSIRQILKAREILCIVPDARKAKAVRDCLEGEVTPVHPSSILQAHPATTVYLDRDSAALLKRGGGEVAMTGVRSPRRAGSSAPWAGSALAARPAPRSTARGEAHRAPRHPLLDRGGDARTCPGRRRSPAGPIRGFFVPPVTEGRDMVELMQRLSLEPTTVTIDRSWDVNCWGIGDYYDGDHVLRGDKDDFRIVYGYVEEELTSAKPFEVLVIPGLNGWSRYTRKTRDAILRRVSEGAGLVLLHPFVGDVKGHPFLGDETEGDERIWEISPLVGVPDDRVSDRGYPELNREAIVEAEWRARPHPITEGLDLALLPSGARGGRFYRYQARGDVAVEAAGLPVIATRTYGKGRVVAFATVGDGLDPRGHRPGEDPHVLGLLGVPALPSRASRPVGRAREGRPEHPQARGDAPSQA